MTDDDGVCERIELSSPPWVEEQVQPQELRKLLVRIGFSRRLGRAIECVDAKKLFEWFLENGKGIRYHTFLHQNGRKLNKSPDKVFAEFNSWLRLKVCCPGKDVDGSDIQLFPCAVADRKYLGNEDNPWIECVWMECTNFRPRMPYETEWWKQLRSAMLRDPAAALATQGQHPSPKYEIRADNDERILPRLLDIAKALNCAGNKETVKLGPTGRRAIGGTILLRHYAPNEGLYRDRTIVTPSWDPKVVAELAAPPPFLPALPQDILESISPYLPNDGAENHPKVWVRSLFGGSNDDSLRLEVGGMDWNQKRALSSAYEAPVNFGGKRYENLSQVYQHGELSIHDHIYGMIAVAGAIITADNCLLLGQRNPRSVIDGAKAFCPSFGEGWDPSRENHPHDTVRRGLKEEWGLTPATGVTVDDNQIQLVAIGREWYPLWHTAFIYTVRVPCSGKDAIRCCELVEAQDEAFAFGAVKLDDPANRAVLYDAVEGGELDPARLAPNTLWGGIDSPQRQVLHPTTGAIRTLYAIGTTIGLQLLASEIEQRRVGDRKYPR